MSHSRFCKNCGKEISHSDTFCPHCGAAQHGSLNSYRPYMKNKFVAALLAIFLGGLGIHKFYLNRPIQGLFYLLFCWTGIPSIIAFIEGIIYLCTSEQRFSEKYD